MKGLHSTRRIAYFFPTKNPSDCRRSFQSLYEFLCSAALIAVATEDLAGRVGRKRKLRNGLAASSAGDTQSGDVLHLAWRSAVRHTTAAVIAEAVSSLAVTVPAVYRARAVRHKRKLSHCGRAAGALEVHARDVMHWSWRGTIIIWHKEFTSLHVMDSGESLIPSSRDVDDNSSYDLAVFERFYLWKTIAHRV